MEDLEDLYIILSGPETMEHYPSAFSYEKTIAWIEWNLNNYKNDGFGLLAVILKEENQFTKVNAITKDEYEKFT